jgi:hypothetical protein
MSPMSQDPFSAVPEGMRWCPHCNGYGSSVKEGAERCRYCAGTGLVADEAAALSAGHGGTARPVGTSRAPVRHFRRATSATAGSLTAGRG